MSDTTTVTLQHPAATLDQALLRRAFGCFPSGVVGLCARIDTDHGPELAGMVAASFVTVSLDPPLVAFCVQWTSSTWPLLEKLPHLGVSVLGHEHDSIARQLSSADRAGRFRGLAVDVSADGAVFVSGAVAWLDCTTEQVVPAGDHGIVLLRINGLTMNPETEPLVFHGSAFRRLREVVPVQQSG